MIVRPELKNLTRSRLPKDLDERLVLQVVHDQVKVARLLVFRAIRVTNWKAWELSAKPPHRSLGSRRLEREEPVELLVEESREQKVILAEVSGVQRQDGMTVRNRVPVDDHFFGEDPLRQVVGFEEPEELVARGA